MEAFESWPEMAATAAHIRAIQRKLDSLHEARDNAWAQLLTTVARLYRAGELGDGDLPPLLSAMKESYGAGFSGVWNEGVPRKHTQVQAYVTHHEPNSRDGSHWVGYWPIRVPYPRDGVCVVYVLYDDGHEPVYVGSTEHFSARMKDHRRYNTKLAVVHSWMASPCADREEAYRLEEKLLAEHKPRLNSRRTR